MKKKLVFWLSETFLPWFKGKAFDLGLILFLALSITVLLTLFLDSIPREPKVGTVAMQDIKADRNYEIVDEKSSEALRDEAAKSVSPVYDFNPAVELEIVKNIHALFEDGRSFLSEKNLRGSGDVLTPEQENQLKNDLLSKYADYLNENTFAFLRRSHFHASFEQLATQVIHDVLQYPVALNLEDLQGSASSGFILRKISSDEQYPEQLIVNLKGVLSLSQAQEKINLLPVATLEHRYNLEFLTPDSVSNLKAWIHSLLKINLTYNSLETDARQQKAKGNIKNTIIKIQAGESIIRRGDRFEPWHVIVIEGILKERLRTNSYIKFFGVFLFVNVVLLIVYFFASRYIRKFHPSRRDLVFLGANLILFLMVLRVGAFLGASIRDTVPFPVDNSTLYYAIPIAGAAMLVRFILNSETAFVFAVIMSLFAGIFLDNSLQMAMYYLLSGVFASHVIAQVDKRSTVLMCGVYTGLVNAFIVVSLDLISYLSIEGTVTPVLLFHNVIAGFFGGLITSMTILVLSPVMETLFNYTTDIKLLELANLSHPLLREMIVRAPGTYHHSQLVGILAEAGAQSIGANPLLARVGSYYHDIGKMKKPQYFIENQKGGENPHDKLAPSMSALIIEAHVKDGIEMAKEFKLPQRIADMIPQHQGTKLMGFFYNKAKQNADPDVEKINERDYRYPGPKPQTREAGIIMLADTIEAAVRSLPEKTPAKIQASVEKFMSQHFVDDQLDECDLTLRDLHLISGAFVKILIGIYHQRVEYPEGALVAANAEVHYLANKGKTNASVSEQQASAVSNVAPLFRNKDSENS